MRGGADKGQRLFEEVGRLVGVGWGGGEKEREKEGSFRSGRKIGAPKAGGQCQETVGDRKERERLRRKGREARNGDVKRGAVSGSVVGG